ncbi:MAG: hypothetical protein PHE73_00610 [Sulfurovaceae bacterium]|nr:hypothetical protein [Sulfurovaceae bacterium]
MNNSHKSIIAAWSKRIITVLMIVIWIVLIFNIAGSKAPFMEQAPYCIISTMTIFGILSLIYKALEWWEKQ